jgi:hypothetical protein
MQGTLQKSSLILAPSHLNFHIHKESSVDVIVVCRTREAFMRRTFMLLAAIFFTHSSLPQKPVFECVNGGVGRCQWPPRHQQRWQLLRDPIFHRSTLFWLPAITLSLAWESEAVEPGLSIWPVFRPTQTSTPLICIGQRLVTGSMGHVKAIDYRL